MFYFLTQNKVASGKIDEPVQNKWQVESDSSAGRRNFLNSLWSLRLA